VEEVNQGARRGRREFFEPRASPSGTLSGLRACRGRPVAARVLANDDGRRYEDCEQQL